MTKTTSNSLQEIRDLWASLPRSIYLDPNVFLDIAKRVSQDLASGKIVDCDNIVTALVEIAQLPDEGKRFELAQALLNISGPLPFVREPWNNTLNQPIRFALNAKDARLIEIYHQNGCVLKEDDAIVVGAQLGDGFWCLPELIFPSMRDEADLYGFAYQIMDRPKLKDEDMTATLKAIEDFAAWADPRSLSSRITDAVCTWQAKRGNNYWWITGKREYQLQTVGGLVKIGLDIEQPIKHIKMNNPQIEEERRGVYREAVAYALTIATKPANSMRKSRRL